jgi:hypothetical protein
MRIYTCCLWKILADQAQASRQQKKKLTYLVRDDSDDEAQVGGPEITSESTTTIKRKREISVSSIGRLSKSVFTNPTYPR